jgi:DNA invertase Pin-like site-specific DNA recombinase
LTPEQREEIKNLRMDGLKLEWIAMEYDVSITTIQRVINTEYKNGATIAIQKKE